MSRGLGNLQRRILDALREYGHRGPFDSVVIAKLAAGRCEITDSEHRSTCRAIRGLARYGMVEVAGVREGRKLWRVTLTGGMEHLRGFRSETDSWERRAAMNPAQRKSDDSVGNAGLTLETSARIRPQAESSPVGSTNPTGGMDESEPAPAVSEAFLEPASPRVSSPEDGSVSGEPAKHPAEPSTAAEMQQSTGRDQQPGKVHTSIGVYPAPVKRNHFNKSLALQPRTAAILSNLEQGT